jgi:predicted GIY-YIG superfamily endonuclease
MNDNEASWSDANALIREHGRGALQHASDKVAEFMHAGDDVEMLRWFEIHERIDEALSEAGAWPET